MRTWILAFCALSPACSISMPLASAEFVADGRDAEVGARDPDQARRLARLANAMAPLLRAELVDVRDEKMRVRVLDTMPRATFGGITFHREHPRWVALARDAEHLEHTLGHEAVHFWLGDTWNTLPPIVEEGLCDMLAESMVGRPIVAERARKLVLLHTWNEGALRMPLSDVLASSGPRELRDQITITVSWSELARELPTVEEALAGEAILPDDEDEAALRHWQASVGEVLARRIGVDALRDLCERARRQRLERVPAHWILAAAGLRADDKEGWRRAFAVLDGEDVRRCIGAALKQGSGTRGTVTL